MKIDSQDIIVGQPILEIRKLLNISSRKITIDAELVQNVLKVDIKTAKSIINELEHLDYLKQVNDWSGEIAWSNTVKGNALANATAAKPILRSTAEKKIIEFLERVKKVNSDKYYLYKVKKIVVFGSYLSNKDRINDIDIAIEILPKHKDPEEQKQLEKERSSKAQEEGKSFRGIIDYLMFPYNEILIFLKQRSRCLSLHKIDELEVLNVEYKILYENNSDID